MIARRALLALLGATALTPLRAAAQYFNPMVFAATPPVLDLLTATAQSGYGLRKLRKAYTGNAINVRRSSDNATQDIGFNASTGNLDTASLLTFVGGGNSGFVTTWYDQVGSLNVTQGTNANQPRIVNAGVIETTNEGNTGINFNTGGIGGAVGLYATSTSYTDTEQYIVIANNAGASPGSFQCVVTSNDNANGGGNCDDTFLPNHWYPSGTNLWNNGSFALPPLGFMGALYNSVTQQMRSVSFNGSFKGLVVGNSHAGMPDPVNDLSSWGGWICELITFGSALSAADKATLYTNQAGFFSISNLALQQLPTSTVVAFSLRKINANYTANQCIKVRRDSDNTTQIIGFTAKGDLDTTSLLSFVGSGSGYIDTWYDQSSFGLNATQSTADSSHQPRIVNAGTLETLNSKPVIRFGLASTVTLNVASQSSYGNPMGEFFAVVAPAGSAFDPSNNPVVFSVNTSTNEALFGDHNATTWDQNGYFQSQVNNGGLASNPTALFSSTLQVVNATRNTAATGWGSMATGCQIGNTNANAGFTFFTGWIGEIIVFAENYFNYSTARTSMYQNQKAYWGTS